MHYSSCFKQITTFFHYTVYEVNFLSDEVPSKTPDDDVDVPVDNKDGTTLIGTEEIGHILDNKGM